MRESTSESTIQEFIDNLDPEFLASTPVHRGDLFNRPANQIKLFDFTSARSREDVETDIEGSEALYETRINENISEISEDIKAKTSNVKRKVYKIDYGMSPESSTIYLFLATTLTISVAYFISS